MDNKRGTILGGAGFYTALAVCLVAVGVSGYFLLFHRADAPNEAAQTPPVQQDTAALAPAQEETEAPPVVETISPEPVEAELPPMPELEIDDTPVVAEAPVTVMAPLDGQVLTAFSMDALVYNATLEDWRTHDGVDIAAAAGSSVLAACSGTVADVTDDPLMGTMVTVDHHDGYQSTYANLAASPSVSEGETVSAGQVIGAVGTTAAAEAAQEPHLHFSVTKDGDAVDPDEFLSR